MADIWVTQAVLNNNAVFLRLWQNKAEMVFCYQNCSDLLGEKIVLVIEKKNFEITRTIYSSSERSEQFMVT